MFCYPVPSVNRLLTTLNERGRTSKSYQLQVTVGVRSFLQLKDARAGGGAQCESAISLGEAGEIEEGEGFAITICF